MLHALIDSLLGACKLKDIGTLFSDKNNRITFILNVDKNKLYLNKYKVYTFNKNNSVANKKIIENNEKVAKKFISLNNIIVQK